MGFRVAGGLPRRILPEHTHPGTVAPVNYERDMGNWRQSGTFGLGTGE
ncbi:hypothetical protein Rhow_007639 [Rhodococcus wratislaviensis]|uniref:Uncharacterized protein n=1 Tax=Rhodococcus wratislaviensis TaxID=44752 RepID=A0A402CIM5_RHOWR|nr:hypothetical protein Rhow_007639 [Rhodococcus wratislaviensis]